MIAATRWVRWQVSKAFNWLAWVTCPEPQKSYMSAIWKAKMGEFKEVADRLAGQKN